MHNSEYQTPIPKNIKNNRRKTLKTGSLPVFQSDILQYTDLIQAF